jgi:hypothetical protein
VGKEHDDSCDRRPGGMVENTSTFDSNAERVRQNLDREMLGRIINLMSVDAADTLLSHRNQNPRIQ